MYQLVPEPGHNLYRYRYCTNMYRYHKRCPFRTPPPPPAEHVLVCCERLCCVYVWCEFLMNEDFRSNKIPREACMRLHAPSPLLALRGGSGGSAPVTLIAAALAATKSGHPVEASDSSDNVVATLIGYVVLAGSLFLYSPIIMQILRSRSGSGLSATSWALSLIGFGGALVYQSACGYPIHTYAELIALTAQTVAILSLLLYFDMHIDYRIIVAGLGAGSALFVALSRAPELVLKALQAVSGTLVTVSILPQILLPFRTGTCGWSPVSAALSTAGTAARVFTTWKITQDKLVLAGFVGGCLMNIVLLIQTFIYPNPIAAS